MMVTHRKLEVPGQRFLACHNPAESLMILEVSNLLQAQSLAVHLKRSFGVGNGSGNSHMGEHPVLSVEGSSMRLSLSALTFFIFP